MKLKTLLNAFKTTPYGERKVVEATLDELRKNGFTHLAVERDGTIFAWSGKDRPLAMHRGNKELDGWFSLLCVNTHGIRNCDLGVMVGRMGYAPVNWHRMVWAL